MSDGRDLHSPLPPPPKKKPRNIFTSFKHSAMYSFHVFWPPCDYDSFHVLVIFICFVSIVPHLSSLITSVTQVIRLYF